jgi:hypothetical protein
MNERRARSAAGEAVATGGGAELADIEIGKIFLAPELSDIWRRNSRTNP